tara:strand:+ start:4634 stop:5392 length:759 start_codon:yes stop_codon:yes gene_type:complete
MSLIYIDIETLPAIWMNCTEKLGYCYARRPKGMEDPERVAKWLNSPAAEEVWRRTALKPGYGVLYCLGMWRTGDDGPVVAIDENLHSLAGHHDCSARPEIILDQLWAHWGWPDDDHPDRPILVGKGIKRFDLPFLLTEARRVDRYLLAKELSKVQVIDLDDLWDPWGKSRLVSLDDMAAHVGADAKQMSGAQVYDQWQAGRFREIEEYCLGDVRTTRQIHLDLVGITAGRPPRNPSVPPLPEAVMHFLQEST